jgi:hypothetical protein
MDSGERNENRFGGGGVFFLYRIPTPANTYQNYSILPDHFNAKITEKWKVKLTISNMRLDKICSSAFYYKKSSRFCSVQSKIYLERLIANRKFYVLNIKFCRLYS